MHTPEPASLILLAGPNGAGKSTFARAALREVGRFDIRIDADELARGISPDDPGSVAFVAGRQALALRQDAFRAGLSLVIETTLASNELFRFATQAREAGYRLSLVYLFVSGFELCDFRVKQRVMQGGHAIPVDVIRRRYAKSLRLFDQFLGLADEAWLYDADAEPSLVLRRQEGNIAILDDGGWTALSAAIDDAYRFPI